VARIMTRYRLSACSACWTARSKAHGERHAAQPPCDWPPVPQSLVPAFSGRAPTL
jgi:hypothetical protein